MALVVVLLLLLLPAPPALAATVDLADIQGTVVPSGAEVRGVVEPGCAVLPPFQRQACRST